MHVLESERFYLHLTLGKVDGVGKAVRAAESCEGDILDWLDQARKIAIDRIYAMTAEERTQVIQHGPETWTARKMLRRMLEHEWEHVAEISERLD